MKPKLKDLLNVTWNYQTLHIIDLRIELEFNTENIIAKGKPEEIKKQLTSHRLNRQVGCVQSGDDGIIEIEIE